MTARPQPLPAPAGGCTKDTDCKGVRVCVSGQCVDRSPATWTPAAAAAPQVRVSSGVALFIPGMAVDFVGLMLFLGGIASANIGSKNNTADDNSSLLPIHTAGSVLSMTGSILLAGAATMPFASSRKLGGKPSAGPMAVAWVFALMSIAVNGALIGISRDDDHRDYKTYMIPGLAVNFAFVIIQSALWSVSRSKAVSAAKEAAARKQAGLVVLPWVAPSQGGATAGLVMVY